MNTSPWAKWNRTAPGRCGGRSEAMRQKTAEYIATVRKMYPRHTIDECARVLGLSSSYVSRLVHMAGHPKRESPWTPDVDAYLRKHYRTTTNQALAEHLRLSQKQVMWRAYRLGLHKSTEHISKTMSSRRLEIIADEQKRIRMGLSRRTRIPLSHWSQRHYAVRHKLLKWGYYYDTDYRVAYYTDKTERHPRFERNNADLFSTKEWTPEVAALYE